MLSSNESARVEILNHESTKGVRKELLDEVKKNFGGTPNIFRTVANSPATLQMLLGSFGALGNGTLPVELKECIALTIANINKCEYCLSAHTAIGTGAGISSQTLQLAQEGKSNDPKKQAALSFVKKVVQQRAAVSDEDVKSLKSQGYNDEEVVEIMGHVALNLTTNYFNLALGIPVDFPKVKVI